jgi:hypothetical protein
MNQEKIEELEKIIKNDYSNIAGIVVQKNGKRLYENYFNGTLLIMPFMYFR